MSTSTTKRSARRNGAARPRPAATTVEEMEAPPEVEIGGREEAEAEWDRFVEGYLYRDCREGNHGGKVTRTLVDGYSWTDERYMFVKSKVCNRRQASGAKCTYWRVTLNEMVRGRGTKQIKVLGTGYPPGYSPGPEVRAFHTGKVPDDVWITEESFAEDLPRLPKGAREAVDKAFERWDEMYA